MKYKISPQELKERLEWPLSDKVKHAIYKFLEYFIKYEGQVYLGFSGGKDSQIVAFIIDEIFKGRWKEFVRFSVLCIVTDMEKDIKSINYKTLFEDHIFGSFVEKVFCDTGLEFPEIRKHVKTFNNVVWMRPKMKFPDVIKNVGVAIGSKHVAMQIRRLKEYMLNPQAKNDATRTLFLTGIKRDGTKSKSFGLGKWLKLLDAPFKTSDKCCDIFKKEPWQRYRDQTGKFGITGTTVVESMQRRASYLKTGCNSFEKGKEMCRPISVFNDEDVWSFAEEYGIRFCEVYYDRQIQVPDGDGGLIEVTLEGEKRTGCMFCLFGIHLESKTRLNRFQRLAISHPKQYEFMVKECGLKSVFDFMSISYKVTKEDILKIKSIR